MNLDFSEFHPLDHNLWECRDYPGGWRRHLQYRWDYQWSEALSIRWRHMTGRHLFAAYAYRPRLPGGAVDPNAREWQYSAICRGCDVEPDNVTAERLIAEMKNRSLPFD